MVVTLSVVGEGPDVNMSHMDVPRDAVSASRSLSTFIFDEFVGALSWKYGDSQRNTGSAIPSLAVSVILDATHRGLHERAATLVSPVTLGMLLL